MTLHVTLPRGPLAVRPGGVTRVPVHIANTGNRPEDVTATVLGSAASWTTLTPPRLLLPPGGEGWVDADLHPPRVAHVRAGPMPFGVQVVAADGPAAAVAEELVVVESFAELCADLVPTVLPGRAGTTWLRLENRGNASRHVVVGARDADGELRFDCRPGGATIPPGESRSLRVRVRGAETPWSGQDRRVRFEVVVRPSDDDPATVSGVLLVRPWFRGRAAAPEAGFPIG